METTISTEIDSDVIFVEEIKSDITFVKTVKTCQKAAAKPSHPKSRSTRAFANIDDSICQRIPTRPIRPKAFGPIKRSQYVDFALSAAQEERLKALAARISAAQELKAKNVRKIKVIDVLPIKPSRSAPLSCRFSKKKEQKPSPPLKKLISGEKKGLLMKRLKSRCGRN